jgi:hypothetical protein
MSPRRLLAPTLVLGSLLVGGVSAEAAGGWYLLVPPRTDYDRSAPYLQGMKILTAKPLSQWAQEGAYDSAEACEAVKASQTHVNQRIYEGAAANYQNAIGKYGPNEPATRLARVLAEIDNANVDAYQASRCAASDDPRLGGQR